MSVKSIWKYLPPAGPILSLVLIALVLLSGVIYYRAVRIQRFLEPALALSQPRNDFTKSINRRFEKEFGALPVAGIDIKSNTILIDNFLLFSADHPLTTEARIEVQKLARIFLSLMEDELARSNISLVLIIARYPSTGVQEVDGAAKAKAQRLAGFILDSLFQAEPELEKTFGRYFAATILPASWGEGSSDQLEFRIIPSEFLHIKVLEKLQKYSR